jgi:sugar phosphate isomerase/epimerase
MREELLGFTSKTFAKVMKERSVSLPGILTWAAAQGFGWVEIRDPMAEMEEKQLRELDAACDQMGLGVHYAWDGTDLLSPSDEELFKRGLRNASRFRTARYARVTIAGNVLKADPTRKGYSREEIRRISQRIAAYGHAAESSGITPVYENSYEPLNGDGQSFYGIVELLQSAKEMSLTFDPANFLNLKSPRQAPSLDTLVEFYRQFSHRIPYVHLKSVGNDGLLPTLRIQDGLEADYIHLMWQQTKLLCIELPETDDVEKGKRDVLDARDRLLQLK